MGHRLSDPLNSWDVLKIIALLLMFVDHSGLFFFNSPADQYWLRAIGRGAAPIFMFLAGYAASYRFNREIFLLALLLSVSDFFVAGYLQTQNILFTILLSRMIFDWLEKRGRHIERPVEWVIGAIALFTTIALVQYGSFGFLFALAGYMKRRPQFYSAKKSQAFLIAAFVFYAVYEGMFSDPAVNLVVMGITLCGIYGLLSRLKVRAVQISAPNWLLRGAKLMSYYSAYIYVGHLIVLEWLTGIPI